MSQKQRWRNTRGDWKEREKKKKENKRQREKRKLDRRVFKQSDKYKKQQEDLKQYREVTVEFMREYNEKIVVFPVTVYDSVILSAKKVEGIVVISLPAVPKVEVTDENYIIHQLQNIYGIKCSKVENLRGNSFIAYECGIDVNVKVITKLEDARKHRECLMTADKVKFLDLMIDKLNLSVQEGVRNKYFAPFLEVYELGCLYFDTRRARRDYVTNAEPRTIQFFLS